MTHQQLPLERISPAEAIDRAWTLPADWYTSTDIFNREQKSIFRNQWQYVGYTGQLAGLGSFITDSVGGVPVVVVRKADRSLAAYINICPHRGHPVALGEGKRRMLQCGYHGWTFDLEGHLKVAPRAEREPCFDSSQIALTRARVETWGPLVFVNLNPEAEPLLAQISGLVSVAEENGFDLGRHPVRASREHLIKCNWKITLDNNTECYHCATVHPGFRNKYHVDADNYEIRQFDDCFAHISKPIDASTSEGQWVDFHLSYIWPNFMVSGRGNDYFYTYTYIPVGPGETLQRNDFFFPDNWDDALIASTIAEIEQIMAEDWEVFERVQVSLNAGVVPHGVLLPDNEVLLRHFQRKCAMALDEL
ncbi:aromatic ring-hydroxylating oxygenase subunit alpha [Mycolicibacterium baixiangningiae]|uniref:aromatic ring-hydroxylating oxygenase subunit alpha n=1 Tax=Mycolicibacterium baixiangningiae TaxID=2761578 RepID=UPI001868029B|nr:aromatic ring-hydroxylating dioxygenase subunit alpha [Mycolicibacterium baixiangningiae]